MPTKKTMINLENAMYLEIIGLDRELLDLIQERGELKKKKDQLHTDTYHNTTKIHEIEKKLKIAMEKIEKKIVL